MTETPAAKLVAKLEAEISKLPSDTAVNRQHIYDKFRSVIAGNPKLSDLVGALDEAIQEIEDRRLETVKSSTRQNVAKPAAESSKPTRTNTIQWLVFSVAVLVILGGGAYWWQTQNSGPISEFNAGIAGYSSAPTPSTSIARDDARYTAKRDGDDYVLEATGASQIYPTDWVEVDTSKTYRVTAKIRTIRDDPQVNGAKTYVGVATFDANGNLQTTAPGTHRYAAMVGRVINSSEGWVEAEGLITGEGNENANQFRPGTKYVKPLALLNYASPDAVSQITYLRFEEVK